MTGVTYASGSLVVDTDEPSLVSSDPNWEVDLEVLTNLGYILLEKVHFFIDQQASPPLPSQVVISNLQLFSGQIFDYNFALDKGIKTF